VAALRVVLVSYPVAMVLLGGSAAIVGGRISHGAVVWGSLGGTSQALGVLWLYAALGAGPISVVSPLAAMLTAAVPVVVGVVLGERPPAVAAFGIVLALIAVVLISRQATDKDDEPHSFTTKTKVAWLTIGSGVAFGLNFALIHQTPVSATVVVLAMAAVSRNLRIPSGGALRLALTAASLEACANVTMLLALHASLLSLASVLISLYPAATVVLAMAVLRERVTRWQGWASCWRRYLWQ
jgi:uncharacterized membrane protein